MISIVNYLFEGKIIEHLKKHNNKYLLGAAGLTAAAIAAIKMQETPVLSRSQEVIPFRVGLHDKKQ